MLLEREKRQNTAKKDLVDWQNNLKRAKKNKICLIYSKIKEVKRNWFIYINNINYAAFVVIFKIFVKYKKLLIIL